MDWNKSNTILIVVFLIVNIFLFSFIYFSDSFNLEYDLKEKEEFLQSVKEILKQKNIIISCEIPSKIHKAPFLEVEYDVISPNRELVENFIGKYDGIINEDVLFYENENESLEIVGMKKIIYEKTGDFNIKNEDSADDIIDEFCKRKNIDISGFVKVNEIDSKDYKLIKFVEKYRTYNLENSYIHFYIKNGEIIKFEMQKIVSLSERANIKSISAAEALLRLMTINFADNKEIVDIQICYYTKENEDFQNINSISVDLVWKVIFSDKTCAYLVGEEY